MATYADISGPNGMLAARCTFIGSSMRAIIGMDRSTGRMSEWNAEVFHSDCDKFESMYIVYSYMTPIAWGGAYEWCRMSSEFFSSTTSRHQELCRKWINYSLFKSESPFPIDLLSV